MFCVLRTMSLCIMFICICNILCYYLYSRIAQYATSGQSGIEEVQKTDDLCTVNFTKKISYCYFNPRRSRPGYKTNKSYELKWKTVKCLRTYLPTYLPTKIYHRNVALL